MRQGEEFLARIMREFRGNDGIDPEQVATAVIPVLAKHVTEGEIEDVKHILPAEIRDLWSASQARRG